MSKYAEYDLTKQELDALGDKFHYISEEEAISLANTLLERHLIYLNHDGPFVRKLNQLGIRIQINSNREIL